MVDMDSIIIDMVFICKDCGIVIDNVAEDELHSFFALCIGNVTGIRQMLSICYEVVCNSEYSVESRALANSVILDLNSYGIYYDDSIFRGMKVVFE